MDDKRYKIIELARECVGTPFQHQGRIPKKGLDCVGLVRYPAIALGFYTPDTDFVAYRMQPDPTEMSERLRSFFDLVSADEKMPGDIIWMKAPEPQHLAIYTGMNIIHAMNTGKGCVVEHGFRYPFTSRVIAWFRYKGLK